MGETRVFGLTAVLATGILLSLWGVPSSTAAACGWSGDVEMRAQGDDGHTVIVGADGRPLSDEEVRQTWSASWETELGNRYRTGRGASQDYGEAVRWYRKAANRGFAGAQNNLAAMYELGLGIAKNEAEAAHWYRAAAKQGDPRAQHSLGLMYRDGRGVSRHPVDAARWIRRSAEQGHDAAIADLARLYWEGLGLKRSASHAYLWWKVAALRGDVHAARQLASIASVLSLDQITQAARVAHGWKPRPEQRTGRLPRADNERDRVSSDGRLHPEPEGADLSD